MREARGTPPALKRFGQHFLSDQAVLEAIASSVAAHPGETIIEIGPGRGALTDLLARLPNRLLAIEIDRALAEQLRGRYADHAHVRIVESDVLEVDLASLAEGPFVVVGNVPYYITTPILFHVLRPPFPRHAVFLVQREVAERMIASPGSKNYGALSVNLQTIVTVEIVRHVAPRAFRPAPKVDSAVVKVVPRSDALVDGAELRRLRTFVQGLFGMRRKQLGNALRSTSVLTAEAATATLLSLDIDPKARPETLSPSQFVSLMRSVSEG